MEFKVLQKFNSHYIKSCNVVSKSFVAIATACAKTCTLSPGSPLTGPQGVMLIMRAQAVT